MFDTVIWCVFNGAAAVLQIVTLCASLKPRFNKYAVFFGACIPFVALALSQRFVQVIAPSVTAVAGIVWFFVAALLFFKDKLRTKIFVSIMIFAIASIVGAVTVNIAVAVGIGTDPQNAAIVDTPYIFCLAAAFAAFVYIRHKRRSALKIPGGQMVAFICFPLSQIIVLYAAMVVISRDGWFTGDRPLTIFSDPTRGPMILLSIAACLCLLSDAVLIYVMLRSSQNERLREELKAKDYQNSLNLEYYRNVEQNSHEARKLRHDLANIIGTACEIVESGSEADRAAAKKMLYQLRDEVAEIKIEKFCQNALVNAIASNKANECRKNGIAYDFNLNVPEKLNIEEIDICKAYVNIFDNAINAAKALEDFALMVNAGADWSQPKDTYTLGTGVRCYFNTTGIYIGGGLDWERIRLEGGEHNNDWGVGIEAGYAYFLSRTVTIEPAVYYKWRFDDSDNSRFGIKVGFGFYF